MQRSRRRCKAIVREGLRQIVGVVIVGNQRVVRRDDGRVGDEHAATAMRIKLPIDARQDIAGDRRVEEQDLRAIGIEPRACL